MRGRSGVGGPTGGTCSTDLWKTSARLDLSSSLHNHPL